MTPNQLHNVHPRQQVVDKILRNTHDLRALCVTWRCSARGQANGAVEPNDFTVEHVVFNDVLSQGRVVRGLA